MVSSWISASEPVEATVHADLGASVNVRDDKLVFGPINAEPFKSRDRPFCLNLLTQFQLRSPRFTNSGPKVD